MTGTWREEHLFNLGQAFKTLQFLDDRLAEYDRKVSVMFAALAETSGNPPPPPTSGYKKNNSKERGNSEIKANIFQFMGFDMTSIPGIGYATAAIIAAELGTNMDSFPNEKHFTSYIGLAPTLVTSAGKKVRQRKRCKNTSRVGRALRMEASTLYRSQTELGAFFRSVARRVDKKAAVKATARRMAHMIFRGVRYGKDYVDLTEPKHMKHACVNEP